MNIILHAATDVRLFKQTDTTNSPFHLIIYKLRSPAQLYGVLVGKPEGKSPLGRLRRRWEDNDKMYLEEVGLGGMDWIELAEDRESWRALVNTVMNIRFP
jgi:hypothetical protein